MNKELAARNPTRPRRHDALAIRRNLRGDLPDAGLRLRHGRSRRGALQGRERGFIYSRYGNPTIDMFEKRMCALEGAEDARATASGMAAVTAAILCQREGRRPHRRRARAVRLLPLGGRDAGAEIRHRSDAGRRHAHRELGKGDPPEHQAVLPRKPDQPDAGSGRHRSASPSSPTRSAPRLVVDNVFATPLLQKPLELGAHIVVYSATKHIDGQGRCLGGVILSDKEWIDENLHDYFRHTGPAFRRSMPGRC